MNGRLKARNEAPAGLGINGVIPGSGVCVVRDCLRFATKDALMCRRHWTAVPVPDRRMLLAMLRAWRRNEITMDVLREAQWACVDAVGPT